LDPKQVLAEADRLWSTGEKIQSIGELEKLFKTDKTFVTTVELFKKLDEMTMYERAYKVL
jgi:hypothetical protein